MLRDALQVGRVKKEPLNEAKMLLVGQRGVGKTGLMKCLLKDDFDLHEHKPEGISIQQWSVTVDGQKIRLNVWDFGGQEIVHATHQFFLTERSLYLLVLDAQLGYKENGVEYWLDTIQRFGKDSRVIIICNKIDEQSLDLDLQKLQVKYGKPPDIVEVSCKTCDGIDKLEAAITREVNLLRHVRNQIPNTWLAVKSQLEGMDKDYISYPEYRNLCQTEGITDDLSQRDLIHLLHDLGIVLNFQNNLRLADTNILNPEWVTNGAHKILNSPELFQSKGVMEQKMLNQILDSQRYPRNKHRMLILDMMHEFELCFDFEGPDQKFLIPYMLYNEDLYTGKWDGALTLQYHYGALPESIISRFTVWVYSSICENTYWRSGVLLEDVDGKNTALVKADRENKKIVIQVRGEEENQYNFLGTIRSDFDHIHQNMKIKPKEEMPLRGTSDGPSASGRVGMGHLGKVIVAGIAIFIVILIVNIGMQADLWISGLFYLVVAVTILSSLCVIGKQLKFHTFILVIFAGILFTVLIGALQLILEGKLSQDNFLELMRELFKQLPLLKK